MKLLIDADSSLNLNQHFSNIVALHIAATHIRIHLEYPASEEMGQQVVEVAERAVEEP